MEFDSYGTDIVPEQPKQPNFVENEELVNDIVDKYKNNFPIVYGVNRSGSTLLRNIMNTIFHGNIAIQCAEYVETDRKIVGVYRDFRDAAVSRHRVNQNGQRNTFDTEERKQTFSWDSVKGDAHEIKNQIKNNLNQFKENYSTEQLLLVKYENFHEDFDYLCDKLEPFFDIVIKKELREFLKITWNKERVRRDYTKPLKEIIQSDPETDFHGGHIYKGIHGTWKELMGEGGERLTEYFAEDLEEWGYEL